MKDVEMEFLPYNWNREKWRCDRVDILSMNNIEIHNA